MGADRQMEGVRQMDKVGLYVLPLGSLKIPMTCCLLIMPRELYLMPMTDKLWISQKCLNLHSLIQIQIRIILNRKTQTAALLCTMCCSVFLYIHILYHITIHGSRSIQHSEICISITFTSKYNIMAITKLSGAIELSGNQTGDRLKLIVIKERKTRPCKSYLP